MSTGCTRGQQSDDDDNDENNHPVLTTATPQRPNGLRRRRHATATTTTTLPGTALGGALVLFLLSPGRGGAAAAEGFESYSGWTSSSRQINDGPVETDLRREGFRQGFVGCLHQEDLCNADEICLDDSLFGRCLVEFDGGNIDEYRDAYDLQDLSSSDASLLRLELEQLSSAGFQWADPYTQCVLQNTITAILNDLSFDEAECDLFLPASERLSGEELSLVGPTDDLNRGAVAFDDGDGDDDSEEEEVVGGDGEIPDMFVVPGTDTEGIVSSVVPKKMPALENENSGSSLEDDPSPLEVGESIIRVDEQPDGSLVVEQKSDDAALFDDFLGRVNSISEQTGATDFEDVISVLQQEIPGLVVYEVEDDNDNDDTDGEAEEYIEDDEDDEEEPSLADFHDVEDYAKAILDAVETEHEQNQQRLEKRGHETVPQLQSIRPEDLVYDYPSDDTFDTDYAEMYYDDEDMTDDQPRRSEELEPQAERPQLGLGSFIFNRRGRLDVKKPGPFYSKSANNFFFDKIDYTDDADRQERRNDTGQVEYEMPLLAPPPTTNSNDHRKGGPELADRLELEDETPELPEEKAERPEFVHIATKRRLRTWGQGKDFIGYLADHFGVPRDALTDRRIEKQHVQFHVAPNPNSVDAVHMAKRIDEDADLRRQIDDDLGVDVDRAAAGHREDVGRVLFPPGTNFNLVLLLVVAVSSAAACLVAATALLVCRRRRERTGRLDKIRRADDDLAETGKAQEEYKQLCRDWSKSGKKVDASSAMRNSPDSNSNDRSSSTSSYPSRVPSSEEPVPNSATKMDISTGHMVLAYMEDHLKNKQRLEQEWVALCGYEAEPCATTIAFKADNKKKNRYPDKLPYDHNRVILNAMVNATGSDYINASTVTDSDPRNPSYIVSQAPLSTTVADFWQMIWEQGCVVIVMLTRLQDNGLQMCHRYWPEEGSEQYHIFEVHLVSEHIWCDDYLVRSVYLKNTRTGETRTVTQFHFRSWPSLGVPTSTRALLEFRRKVNKSYRGRSCPIAVHCSDGVGRAGTYILIDMVLNRMSKGCKEIDIAATLEHIRDQRGGGMVQSRGQFEFCLMAVAEEVHAILKALPQ